MGEEGDYACVELTDLEIDEPYVCVKPAESQTWALANTLFAMLEAEDAAGEPVVFTWGIVPRQPPPTGDEVPWWDGGVAFDAAHRSLIPRPPLIAKSALRYRIDMAEQKWIAIGRGRNEYLGGHVELADPEVRQWLVGLVTDAMDKGMDGVDIRMGSHTETLDQENYGFHPAIVEAYRERYGIDITKQSFDRPAWRKLRGEYFDQFLREVGQAVRGRDGKVLIHLQLPDGLPVHRPMRILKWPGTGRRGYAMA